MFKDDSCCSLPSTCGLDIRLKWGSKDWVDLLQARGAAELEEVMSSSSRRGVGLGMGGGKRSLFVATYLWELVGVMWWVLHCPNAVQ